MKPLTPRQSAVYVFCAGYVRSNGYPPSLREIARHFRRKSYHSAYCHLSLMAQKGWVKFGPQRASRAYRLVQP